MIARPLKGSDHKTKFLLTNREREVFELLVQDKTTRDIAGQLFISEKTVRNHISKEIGFETHPSVSGGSLVDLIGYGTRSEPHKINKNF